MKRSGAVFGNRFEMFEGRVAYVGVPRVVRELFVTACHEVVAVGLRDDRRCCDAFAPLIPLDDGAIWPRRIVEKSVAVDE